MLRIDRATYDAIVAHAREDPEPPEDLASEDGQQLAVYYRLTGLQGSLVDALAAGRAGRR